MAHKHTGHSMRRINAIKSAGLFPPERLTSKQFTRDWGPDGTSAAANRMRIAQLQKEELVQKVKKEVGSAERYFEKHPDSVRARLAVEEARARLAAAEATYNQGKGPEK